MIKKLFILLLMPSLVFAEGNIFIEVDHYSQIKHHDLGLSMVNLGAEGCNKYNFCIEGKVGTPIADNDMKYGETNYIDGFSIGGTSWDTGDLIGGISIKYKLFNWK